MSARYVSPSYRDESPKSARYRSAATAVDATHTTASAPTATLIGERGKITDPYRHRETSTRAASGHARAWLKTVFGSSKLCSAAGSNNRITPAILTVTSHCRARRIVDAPNASTTRTTRCFRRGTSPAYRRGTAVKKTGALAGPGLEVAITRTLLTESCSSCCALVRRSVRRQPRRQRSRLP